MNNITQQVDIDIKKTEVKIEVSRSQISSTRVVNRTFRINLPYWFLVAIPYLPF